MMEIKEWPSSRIKLKDIKLDNDNPNVMDEETEKRLNKSMEEWGYTQDIVIDKNSMVLADGEHRLKQLLKEGKEEALVKLVEFKDDASRRAYRQAANKIKGVHDKSLDAKEYLKIIEAGKENLLKLATGRNITTEEAQKMIEENQKELQKDIEKVNKIGNLTINCPKCGHRFEKKNN